MLKTLVVSISIFLISACTSTPVVLYSDPGLSSDKVATLTTKCDSQCKSLIGSQLGFDSRYQMNRGLLLEVNGKQGSWEVSDGMAFNSSMNGSFNIKVREGQAELVVDHNSNLVIGKPERFSVNLSGGHTYVIGRIRIEYIKMRQYRWFPVVFDASEGKVIYGNESYFSKSTKLTCMQRKKDEKYCSCFAQVLDKNLSYAEKEAVIFNKESAVSLVLDTMESQEAVIEACRG